MNERIRELLVEARFMAEETINKQISKNAELDAFAEKFAELIIEECANVADENYIHRGSRTCGLAIRLHFGVEEK